MYIHALCSQPRIYVINYTCYASTIRRAPCPPHTSATSSPAYIPLCHAAGQISSDHTSRFSASWSFCPTSRRCWLTLFRRDSHVATEMVIKEKTIHAMRMPSSRPIWFFVLKMICGSAVGRQVRAMTHGPDDPADVVERHGDAVPEDPRLQLVRHCRDTGVSSRSRHLRRWDTHETLTMMSGTRKNAMNLGPRIVIANSVARPTDAMPR